MVSLRRVDRQKGVAVVEFALVLPLLVLLAFGIIEFSLALYDKAIITNASREGARNGIVFSTPPVTDAEIETAVNNYCQNKLVTLGLPGAVTTYITREGSGESGDDLTVRVEYPYNFLVLPGFVAGLIGGMNLHAETVMRME
jgi:Flp pilus assembly protein TadG